MRRPHRAAWTQINDESCFRQLPLTSDELPPSEPSASKITRIAPVAGIQPYKTERAE